MTTFIGLPALTSTSATVPSRSAWSAASIFIASGRQEHVAGLAPRPRRRGRGRTPWRPSVMAIYLMPTTVNGAVAVDRSRH